MARLVVRLVVRVRGRVGWYVLCRVWCMICSIVVAAVAVTLMVAVMCVRAGGGREEGGGEERHALRTARLRPSHRLRRRMLGGEPATGCNGIRRQSLGPNGGRLHWSANGRAQAVACQSIHPQR